jgi:hypothetical protein
MLAHIRLMLALWILGAAISAASAQERGFGGASDPNAVPPPPPGVDKFYWDLSHSQDRVTKSMADRYLAMVKAQEWSDLSGKFTTFARYVKHAPDLSTVTIEISKGPRNARTTEQKTVPVDKLSKTCQSRVRQIDAMQKKLKELAAAAAKNDANAAFAGGPGAAPENPGAPMTDDRGTDPRAAANPEGPGPGPTPPPAPPEPDPSAAEPDPLGFAEIVDLPTGPEAGPGPPGPGPGSFSPGPPPGREGERR